MKKTSDDKTCSGILLGGIFSGGLVMVIFGVIDGFPYTTAAGAVTLGFWGFANYRYIVGGKRCDRDIIGRMLSSGGRRFYRVLS